MDTEVRPWLHHPSRRCGGAKSVPMNAKDCPRADRRHIHPRRPCPLAQNARRPVENTPSMSLPPRPCAAPPETRAAGHIRAPAASSVRSPLALRRSCGHAPADLRWPARRTLHRPLRCSRRGEP
ncbi:hypothetical protein PsYK624_063320 [Phanerochaete sordida]|uniref:Uncharacterized protein n=1 Tax=Phanerochaete sordida TaxID=48140 RepID=A0A9P3LC71_9APHY|nr:hypothetical protein PsYK624_063320 [Phanerochaete sordida]